MNKRRLLLFLVLGLAIILSGCSLKTTRYEQTIDVSSVDYSKLSSMKQGKACMRWILGIPVGFDNSLATAAENGGIKVVRHVETEFTLPPIMASCTVAYGD